MQREWHVVFGAVLGILAVATIVVFGFNWGVERVKTAAVSIPAPIMFQPK